MALSLRLGTILLTLIAGPLDAQSSSQDSKAPNQSESKGLIETGAGLFQQNCAFCHGRDAAGGETGPDLTASQLVEQDVHGSKIGAVIRNGRPEKGMPAFSLPDPNIEALVAFIHSQATKAKSQVGGRRGVDISDLQTGNADKGKAYFNGAGGCSGCHSPSGDLAGVASRYRGLKLEERLLYPEDAPVRATISLPSGQTVSGRLAYRDEFTIGIRDSDGWYRAWRTSDVTFSIDDPAEAHVKLLAKYSDDDIHNLMAYLQTLK